jgi:hypothetical protein
MMTRLKLGPAIVLGIVVIAALALLAVPAVSLYYEAGGGENCARCHEIRPAYDRWHKSSHRGTPCRACHGDAWTTDLRFHANNFQRVRAHAAGQAPDIPRLREADLPAMMERCRGCHRQEFADWQGGPHSGGYRSIFLDAKHNSERMLMDDCLRCHGMHFEGGIRDLVTPVSHKGPWRLLDETRASRPVIPCLTCHTMHRQGDPLGVRTRSDTRVAAREELHRPSLAFFDRREMRPVSITLLSLPEMKEGERAVRISPDTRQRLCYQCHAPLADTQIRSGDDRTPVGVHEGLSCLACHQRHRMNTRASCADCHPRLSNCGIDVEKMDTSFASKTSSHNIHWVKCLDCHPKGVPKRKVKAGEALGSPMRSGG